MDISKKSLIFAVVINLILIAVCAVCLILTKLNPVILWVALAVLLFVLITSIIAFVIGKNIKKSTSQIN